eukprot:6210571-Pleurochrysis_carterae.AAC.1
MKPSMNCKLYDFVHQILPWCVRLIHARDTVAERKASISMLSAPSACCDVHGAALKADCSYVSREAHAFVRMHAK